MKKLMFFAVALAAVIVASCAKKGGSNSKGGEDDKLAPVVNDNVVDTAGAGDWTAAALISRLYKDKELRQIGEFSQEDIIVALSEAQAVGAKSCSYEGARGMMQPNQ